MTKHFLVRHKIAFCRQWPEKRDFLAKIGCADSQALTLIIP